MILALACIITGAICAALGWFACRFWHGPLIEKGREYFDKVADALKSN